MRFFYDFEHDEVLTLTQLEAEYKELKEAGETEAETFKDYLTNCLSNDGCLEEL